MSGGSGESGVKSKISDKDLAINVVSIVNIVPSILTRLFLAKSG